MSLTPTEASKRIGRASTFIRDLLQGRKQSITETNARRLAPVLGTSVEWLLEGRGPESAVDNERNNLATVAIMTVPVLGAAELSAWREGPGLMASRAQRAEKPIQIAAPPGYEGKALFALQLRGSAMNKLYAPDAYLIVCPTTETDARIGDHVIVERRKNGFTETVCAELGANELIFHSTDPNVAASRPLRIANEDQEIIGVVIGDQRLRDRPALLTPKT